MTPAPVRPPSRVPAPAPTGNRSPEFEATVKTERSIAENSPAGTIVSGSVSASDRDGDTVVFGLSGADSASFAIDRKTGRITVGTEADLDYETKSAYELTVTATDPSKASANITITVSLTNQEEAGTVTLASEQPKAGDSLAAEVSDPDGGVSNTTWLWESSQDHDGLGGDQWGRVQCLCADSRRRGQLPAGYGVLRRRGGSWQERDGPSRPTR